jgi:hypothetical protein
MEKSKSVTLNEIQTGCQTMVSQGRTQYDLYYMSVYNNMDKAINNDLLSLKFT